MSFSYQSELLAQTKGGGLDAIAADVGAPVSGEMPRLFVPTPFSVGLPDIRVIAI